MCRKYNNYLLLLLVFFVTFIVGCTDNHSVSVKDSASSSTDELQVVQTTDNGDHVLKDADGNQFVVYKEESGDDSWEISADNYRSKTVSDLPVQYQYEVSGGTYGGTYQVHGVLELSKQYTGTDNDLVLYYTYLPDNDSVTMDEYSTIPDNLKAVLTEDHLKSLIKEMIAVKDEYNKLK